MNKEDWENVKWQDSDVCIIVFVIPIECVKDSG
jgi:hypothetical protein